MEKLNAFKFSSEILDDQLELLCKNHNEEESSLEIVGPVWFEAR